MKRIEKYLVAADDELAMGALWSRADKKRADGESFRWCMTVKLTVLYQFYVAKAII